MKRYRAVGVRCAVNVLELGVPIVWSNEILEVLRFEGFDLINIDIVNLAREWVGKSKYRRGSRLSEAPNSFDCSSFMKWLYGQKGIWLPRRSIQQSEMGTEVEISQLQAGDLIFTQGCINYFHSDPRNGIGHVGMATGEGSVIHAANSEVGLQEVALDAFAEKNEQISVIRRYFGDYTITLKTPLEREVESSDDIRWIILSSKKVQDIQMRNGSEIQKEIAGYADET